MTAPSAASRLAYSPELRTALVLTGSGTAGAYHAGVLRAFQEAGVKVDVVAGTGMGAVSALFAAVDGATRLWSPDGLWRARTASRYYRVRTAIRAGAWMVAVSLAVVLLPLLVPVAGVVVYPLDFLLRLVRVSSAGALTRSYAAMVGALFDPASLAATLSRGLLLSLVLLVGTLGALAIFALVRGGKRRDEAPIWWRIVGAPLSSAAAARTVLDTLWQLVGGAAGARRPGPVELSRVYTELLRDNVGQPGFRELLITVHDLDMRRDLVFALVGDRYRRDFFRASEASGGDRRLAEGFDLAGVSRDHLIGAVLGALTLPVATEVRLMEFPPESYWCGEVHRVASRPGAVDRILAELPLAGVEQVIVVSAFPELDGPHRLSVPRSDWRGRLSDYLAGAEAAALRSASAAAAVFRGVYLVKPAYNPLGPLDVAGSYDQRSDRVMSVGELVDRGYQDAYRQFIDPVVGASGERLNLAGSRQARDDEPDADEIDDNPAPDDGSAPRLE